MATSTQQLNQIISTITPADAEELQWLKQLAMTGCGDCASCQPVQEVAITDRNVIDLIKKVYELDDAYADYREPQCASCRYFEKGEHQSFEHPGEPSSCLIAWDGEDEDETCEQVEISLFMLAEKHECPHYTVKGGK